MDVTEFRKRYPSEDAEIWNIVEDLGLGNGIPAGYDLVGFLRTYFLAKISDPAGEVETESIPRGNNFESRADAQELLQQAIEKMQSIIPANADRV